MSIDRRIVRRRLAFLGGGAPGVRKSVHEGYTLIVVEPVPHMSRRHHKTAVITLRTAPHAPVYVGLGRGQVPDLESSARSAATTETSHSSDSRARIAAT